MVKKLLSLAMALTAFFTLSAQTPLPENPNVKHGTLPNGLNYYILHNDLPKERANFYIAQKVGSTLETPQQLGLAHFLEHMAFNGTKNFPGKSMLNYLQDKGIRFGADINAYTAFDETVYNINNVPTTDVALMDSVLLALHDWSCALTLDTEEINAERGVIQEEWRMRNDAQNRMMTAMLPAIYSEYQYRQMPIGTMDVVMNFDPQVLRDYYHKWYRPDQQGIIIVGDFDSAEMEQKVKEMFSKIPMPENAAERTYPTVSDNKEPIYFEFEDPEMQYSMARLAFKSDVIPFEQRNTVEAFMQENILKELITMMLDNRLDEYSKKAECKYANAGVYFGDFMVSKTKDAFYVVAIAKDDIRSAFDDALSIVTRACKTGFTEGELQRAKDDLTAQFLKQYNERNTTKNDALAKGLIRYFIDNKPAPGADMEKQMADMILPQLNVQLMNQMASAMLTPENQVLMIAAPTKTPTGLPGKEVMLQDVNDILGREYEAYVDEVITDPLIANYLPAGKVVSTKENTAFGTTEYTLSNGMQVIVKPTDFSSDEILLNCFRNGGKEMFAGSQAANLTLISDAVENSRLGAFAPTTLSKYLAGKNVSLGFDMGNKTENFQGRCGVKDFETLLDLLYAQFTAVNPDKESYEGFVSRLRPQLEMQQKNPMFELGMRQAKAVYGNNPMTIPPTVSTLDQANYEEMLKIYNGCVSNAADYTLILVGNVDKNTLVPMLEKYVASLPGGQKSKAGKPVTPIVMAKGMVQEEFDQPMQAPSTIIMTMYNGYNLPFNVNNDVRMELVGEILSNIYTETLREEEGGSYSPYAYGSISPVTKAWSLTGVVQTNADQQARMIERGNQEVLKLLQNGAKPEQFNKVKEAALKQYEINVRTNRYWLNNLQLNARGWDMITGNRDAIEKLTLKEFNAFMKKLWDKKNRIQIIMTGVPEKK